MTPLKAAATRILGLIDLTSLNEDDSDKSIIRLCEKAGTKAGNVAAVCVYPRFIGTAKTALSDGSETEVKIATVVNFPAGGNDIDQVANETQQAVKAGANEVDLVFPYPAFMHGNVGLADTMIKACKLACGEEVLLKVILETGELKQPVLIKSACQIAIDAGADFIKTSTGKVDINATLEAAQIILQCIKESGNIKIGFKAAGGIRSVNEANNYLNLAETIMGSDWLDASHFRFGASTLLDDVLFQLGISSKPDAAAY